MRFESKKFWSVVVWAGAMSVGVPAMAAAVNLVSNPDFEANTGGANASAADVPATVGNTTYGWQGYNPYNPPYGAFYTASINHTPGGSQAGKTYGGPNSGIFQEIGLTGGHSYTGSVYAINSSGDALGGGAANTIDLRIQFFDVNGAATGTLAISPTTVSGASTKDVWTQLSVTATAPANAVYCDFRIFQNNPGYSGGALLADDASLVDNTAATPEPATLGLAGVAVGGLLARRRTRA